MTSPLGRSPLTGLRGVRQGLRWPQVYRAQLLALLWAVRADPGPAPPRVEVILPLVGDVEELRLVRGWVEEIWAGEGALPRMVRAAYHLLGLRTFLTTGEKESRAWTFRAGARAPECAGVIHSDMQRGFIRAEVIHWDELLSIGSWSKARLQGRAPIL